MVFYDDGMPGSRVFYAPSRVGGLRLARVVNVYPLDFCVDIVYVDYFSTTTSGMDKGDEGAFRIRVPVLTDMAGAVPEENWFSEENNFGAFVRTPLFGYGRAVLPRVGDYVLVGFINENYNAPVVIGCLHPRIRWMNLNGATEDPTDTKGPTERGVVAEEDRYITVYPSGFWFKVNKDGEVEISFPLGKEANEAAGFFIKVGRDDPVGQAKGLTDMVVRLKERAEELKEATRILDLPEVRSIISQIQTGTLSFQRGLEVIRQLKEVQKILSGDPTGEEDYVDSGCCCGAEGTDNPPANCCCGARWATCSQCQSTVSGCPYVETWTCRQCGTTVRNPRMSS
ncbi:phage baseplate assembly protein V [Candidatus Caldatribacterium sp.]|uniref:phage baseplate assembly protein V n=1 Tax=Candidatus Caldatribacterium sp. TaxID=2282143 RepID=UPI00384372CE|nr:phage baseplate assembly protein V [Candidatus Caldatribacterium sp.]